MTDAPIVCDVCGVKYWPTMVNGKPKVEDPECPTIDLRRRIFDSARDFERKFQWVSEEIRDLERERLIAHGMEFPDDA